MSKPVRWAVATALVVASGVVPPHASAAGCAAVRVAGKWSTTNYPTFPAEPVPLHKRGWPAYPIHAAGSAPSEVFVSNGASVMRTADGGCTWSTVFDLAATAASVQDAAELAVVRASQAAVVAMQVAPSRVSTAVDPHASVVLLISDGSETTFLAVSHDDARTWQLGRVAASCDGLPSAPMTGVHDLLVTGPATAYLRAFGGAELDDSQQGGPDIETYNYLLSTTDAGVTWQCAHVDGSGLLTPDPGDPRRVWDMTCTRLRRTDDRGVHWTALRVPWPYGTSTSTSTCGLVYATDAFRPRRGPARLLLWYGYYDRAVSRYVARFYRSLDGGATWGPITSPVTTNQQVVAWAGFDGTGQPVTLVAEGVAGISPPSGYTVRTYDDKRRRWIVTTSMAERIVGCDHPALSTVRLIGRGDPQRVTTLMTGDVYYSNNGCPFVLIRYDPRGR